MRRGLFAQGLFIACWAISSTATAQTTFNWLNAAGGSFANPSHWSPGGPPGSADTARFSLHGGYTVHLVGDVTNDQLIANAQKLSFDLGGFTYTLAGFYPCADFAAGSQLFFNGTLDTVWASVNSSLVIEQPTMTWENFEVIYIGTDGSGSVEARQGAHVTSIFGTDIGSVDGSSGSLVVRDPGTTWTCSKGGMTVGSYAPGDLLITDGAVVSSMEAAIGNNPDVVGTATISQGGDWNIPIFGLSVGSYGDGTMIIEDGGTVTATNWVTIGENSGSAGELLVRDFGLGAATLNVGSYLAVGEDSSGLLKIETQAPTDSAHVNVGQGFYVAYETGTVGDVYVTGPGSMLEFDGGVIGQGGVATIYLRDGGAIHAIQSMLLGEGIGSQATLWIDEPVAGASPTLTVGNKLVVGSQGDGALNVVNTGSITALHGVVGYSEGSTGSFSIVGADSATFTHDLIVGDEGQGTFTATATPLTSSTVTAGRDSTGEGTFSMSGGTMTVSPGPLTVGYQGTGTMTATGGAVINCLATPDGFIIAAQPGSYGDVTISGMGTLVDVAKQFAMERSSEMVISDHGVLKCRKGVSPTSSAGIIAGHAGAFASVTVETNGLFNCVDGFLNVGFRDGSNGTLVVQDGGKVTSVGGFIGRLLGATGQATVTGTGSQWLNSATLSVGVEGTGKLTVNDAGLVVAPSTIVGTRGTLQGSGGTIDAPLTNQGIVEPGHSGNPGLLTVDANYTQTASGTLRIKLGGPAPGTQHSQLVSTGNVALAGKLELSLAPGYSPPSHQTWEVVLACPGCTRSGTFSQIIPANTYTVTYTANSVIIGLPVLPCPADIAPGSGDGQVNVQDLLALIAAWGPCTPPCEADLNGDGVVNVSDLLQAITQWGTCP